MIAKGRLSFISIGKVIHYDTLFFFISNAEAVGWGDKDLNGWDAVKAR